VEHAWLSFSYGLLLMAGGFLVVLYCNIRDEHPHQVFALIWALIMLLATWQHVRYEYYLAISIALLSALCVGFVLDLWGESRISRRDDGPSPSMQQPGPARKKAMKPAGKKHEPAPATVYLTSALALLVIGVSILFAFTSVSDTYAAMQSAGPQMISDWKESLTWMGNNTPETGVDYLRIYDPVTFRYPEESYGVMSWWDYGHMITYIAKRIPNANPFQQGVAGPDGSAAYFVSTEEAAANRILDHDGTRYIVTDILMADIMSGKFHAMATWYNSTAGLDPFTATFYVHDGSGQYETARLIRPDYYLTMVSRLHNFDGAMTEPSAVFYAEYADPDSSGIPVPILTGGSRMNVTDAIQAAAGFNANASAGTHAGLFGFSLVRPAGTVPALRHYRLVHESPSNVYGSAAVDVKFVKVFEYVKGARIPGSGVISLQLVTGTGRHYLYRQESVNGEFIVPYATAGANGDVRAEGLYLLEGTGQTFSVPEQAVLEGLTIN
jgi:dolichyl-diphosphooligosaccharide--protein glycosyltransferase